MFFEKNVDIFFERVCMYNRCCLILCLIVDILFFFKVLIFVLYFEIKYLCLLVIFYNKYMLNFKCKCFIGI